MEPSSLRPPESERAGAATPDAPATPGIEPKGRGIVLEDERWSKLRFSVVEDPLNVLVLHTLQHTKFALRGTSQPISGLGRGGPCVRIDADPAVNSGGNVASAEVLPIVSLS